MRRASIGAPPQGQRDPTTQWLVNAVQELAKASYQDTAEDLLAAIEAGAAGTQPLDATLTALAGLDTDAGLLAQTGADAFTQINPVFGQCYLSLSSGDLLLSRENGKYIFINGAFVEIPSSGPTLDPTGVTTTGGISSTALYYIYAYVNAGTLTLEFDDVAYATDSTYGHKIKSGDATRTLVGMWMASGADTWSSVAVQGVSYFNPKAKFTGVGPVSSTTGSASTVEISSSLRNTFITFADRPIHAVMQVGLAGHSGAAQNLFFTIGLDGVSTVLWSTILQWRTHASTGNIFYAPHHSRWLSVSEAVHYVTPGYQTSSATLSASNVFMDVTVWG